MKIIIWIRKNARYQNNGLAEERGRMQNNKYYAISLRLSKENKRGAR